VSPISHIRTKPADATTLLPALKAFLATAFSPDGPPRLDTLAREARCSVRTLQRRLQDAGLTYTRVLDEVRLETAAQLLRESELRVVDVAVDLGYSDQANFSRAFRRWAGVSPTQFRIGREPDADHRLT
jgi:AraC-like DNA-binding protein